jgi:predicted RNase H-like HicB family nuclease
MVTRYLRAAMRGAKYEVLEEGGYYGSIPGFDGAWADGVSLEECRDELEEVLEEWLLFATPGGG